MFEQGICPTQFKEGGFKSIFKKGNKIKLENYKSNFKRSKNI